MGFFKEFREFAVKGNVVDLAVGLIIGAAFGAIVKSLVDDILMPVIGLLTGRVDLGKQFIVLRGPAPDPGANVTIEQARQQGGVIITYGTFLNAIVTFILVAFAVFLLVKQINRLRRQEKKAPADPTEKNCPYCFLSIPIKATRCGHCTSEIPSTLSKTPT